jgi:hypothetical protein
MIHFADDAFLQEYFRKAVIEIEPGAVPLVPADPPAFILERIESAATFAERAADRSLEARRRRQFEAELAAGRAVFQKSGLCHLCGPTMFLVRRAGPATVALTLRHRTEAICTGCSLDGAVRGALHALDTMTSLDGVGGVLLAIADPGARQFLQKRYPQCSTLASSADLASHAPGGRMRYRHAVCLERAANPQDAARKLQLLSQSIVAGGILILGGDFAAYRAGAELLEPATEGLVARQAADAVGAAGWDVVEQAREAGLVDAAAYSYWSDRYGYVGRDHVLYAARAESRAPTG